jgi:plastocyanin
MKTFSLTLSHTLCAVSLAYFLPLQPVHAESVSGHIDIVAQSPVKKIIVYLQAAQQNNAPNSSHQQSKTFQISQKDTRFNPGLTVITEGDQVQWLNNETREIDHNIYSLSEPNRFDLGLGAKGSTLEHQFNQTGEVNYYCSVHKSMEGKIVVLPSRYYQFLEQPGEFKLDNVPQGKWTLNAIVFHRRYKAEPVDLTVGKIAVQNLTLKLVKR